MTMLYLLPNCIDSNYAKELAKEIEYSKVAKNVTIAAWQDHNYTASIFITPQNDIIKTLQYAKTYDVIYVWDFVALGVPFSQYEEIAKNVRERKMSLQIINPHYIFDMENKEFLKLIQAFPQMSDTSKYVKNTLIKPKKINLIDRLTPEIIANIRLDKKKGSTYNELCERYKINQWMVAKLTPDIKGVKGIITYQARQRELRIKEGRQKAIKKVKLQGFYRDKSVLLYQTMKEFLESKTALRTRSTYQYNIARLYKYAESINEGFLASNELFIKHTVINQFLNKLKESKYNDTSISTYHASFKSWFTYLRDLEMIKLNPMALVQKQKLEHGLCRTEHLEKEELLKVFSTIAEDIKNAEAQKALEETIFFKKQCYVFFLILATTGLRSGCILNLKRDAILHNEKDHIKVQLKGKHCERVRLKPEVINALNKYLGEYSLKHDYNYNIFRDSIYSLNVLNQTRANLYFKAILKKLNINIETRLHVFRVSFAVNCYKSGMDLVVIRDLMFHSDISMTCRYIKRTKQNENSLKAPSYGSENIEDILSRKQYYKENEAFLHGQ